MPATEMRGRSRLEIQQRANKQKYAFIQAFNNGSMLTEAATIANTTPRQMRRWRDSDPYFNQAVTALETMRLLVERGQGESEKYQIALAQVRVYNTWLGQEIKDARRRLKGE